MIRPAAAGRTCRAKVVWSVGYDISIHSPSQLLCHSPPQVLMLGLTSSGEEMVDLVSEYPGLMTLGFLELWIGFWR